MTCPICQQSDDLCESHILSKFVYKPLKEEEGHFYVLSNDPERPTYTIQGGVIERLLCLDCEAKRNRWETYVANKIHRGDLICSTYPHKVEGLDYARFKLFMMSTLFMASLSNDEMFASVTMRPDRQELLRQLLDKENPGSREDFACMLWALTSSELDTRRLIIHPVTVPGTGAVFHRFVFAGFMWIVGDFQGLQPSTTVLDRFLTPQGSLIVNKKDIMDLEFLTDTFAEFRRLGKLDK
ncbi:MAG: hypothetical protein KAU50_06805 [Candidatus Marinimicrobia bacterium]|nr:hypothetical protein [Candidatus Neomarinimicrobiota bacterium]